MTIYNKIDNFITKLFIEEQEARGILVSGEITPELDLELSQIQQNLAEKIEEILDYQASVEPNIVEIAASAGQYKDNGLPLVFILYMFENQNNLDMMYLKIALETCVEDWVEEDENLRAEYEKTIHVIHCFNKTQFHSNDMSYFNQIMKRYTNDYVDFEYDEENNEWHGNIF